MERFQLSCPGAPVSKTGVYSCSTTSAYKLGSGIHFELVAFVANFHIPPGLGAMYTGGRSASRTHQQLFCRQSLYRLGSRPWCEQPDFNRYGFLQTGLSRSRLAIPPCSLIRIKCRGFGSPLGPTCASLRPDVSREGQALSEINKTHYTTVSKFMGLEFKIYW